MNYRHIYHAGNFADVFKHVILTGLLQALQRKAKGFCYLDTHAGIGRYDLQSEASQKTGESFSGIRLLLRSSQSPFPLEVQSYLSAVSKYGEAALNEASLRFYPGSPCIARHFLRPQDRMILSELHPEDCQTLKKLFQQDKQVAVHELNGYQALKAFLPPQERRGLVLIDPPFENSNEIENLGEALAMALERWETGMYAVWYPLKDQSMKKKLYQHLVMLKAKAILMAELSVLPEDLPLSLNGSGMAIINPPWQFDTVLTELLPWLWRVLSPEKLGSQQVFWLK